MRMRNAQPPFVRMAMRLWSALVRSGGPPDLMAQAYVVNVFSLLAFLSLMVFGLLQILSEHDPRLGCLELAGSGAILLNGIGLRMTHKVSLARDLLLLSILAFLVVMLVSGGTQGTGVFWFFVFPVSAFFLAGKRRGLYWMGGLLATTLLLGLLKQAGSVTLAYNFVQVRQLLVSVAVVAAGMYTYQHAREQAETQIRREQQEIDRAKNEFLALASHQLRTPISAISWYSEMLLHGDGGALSSDQQEYVQQVHESNQRSADIVDAIITVSNLQGHSIVLHTGSVDVPALCREVLQHQLAGLRQAKDLQIHQHYEANLPKLHADEALVRTIVQNLCSNAIKYTPAGGQVTINVARDSEILAPGSRGSLRLTVTDTGYGIPQNQQHKVFAKLFRATNIKVKDTDGTGLGLYIVKAILEQTGGRIRFESAENKGSTFTVLLPLEGMRARANATGAAHV